ncbi:MAG: biotin transporter BioY [Chloroflexi bacterium]|nr:biotin transporter BioY [Chloroflexota bacterium]
MPLVLRLTPDRALWRAAAVVLGSLFIALCAQIAVPLPFTPVPVTGQTFAILLVGAAFGSRLGAATVLAYIVEGSAGLAVWAPGATQGFARLAGPTGGYIAGFLFAAYAVGWLVERGWGRRIVTLAAAMLVGEVIVYAIGLPRLAAFVPAERVLDAGLIPFVVGDLYKMALATLAVSGVSRIVPR